MRTSLLSFLFLLVLVYTTQAQNLLDSRQSSLYTYIYRISNEEAEGIYHDKKGEAYPGYFHTLIDSFYTDSIPSLHLPQGHYLRTAVRKGVLQAEIASIQDFYVAIFNNSADLCIGVQDSLGLVLPEAVVKAGHRQIPFDRQSQLFRLAKANKKGMLMVEYGGFKTWYDLDRRWNNPAWKRTLNGKPLRYIWQPLRFITYLPADAVRSINRRRPQRTVYQVQRFFVQTYHKVACLFNREQCDEDQLENKWQGYLVFNKPKFLPGDTVRYKAFLVNKKGRPLEDSVMVALSKSWKDQKELARIAPYRPGAYSGEFVLHDSLSLQLDKSYEVLLQKKKDQTYIRRSFRYEDYELHSISLAVRSEVNRHFRSGDFEIFLKGTDENDLNLADARVEITLRPLRVLHFVNDSLFLPDTLLHLEQALEPSGETVIAIPDSIFPALNLEYELLVNMLTSDNERKTERQVLTFYHQLEEPVFELRSDSIRVSFQRNGKSVPASAALYGYDQFDNLLPARPVDLPHQEKLNTQWLRYGINVNGMSRDFSAANEPALLRCRSERGTDSLKMDVDNPRKIPFRYFIYELNREIERGFGTSLSFLRRETGMHKYQIVLQYLWGGVVQENYYESTFSPNKLNIRVEQPALVYPGQQTDIRIAVSDQEGRPVPDVDLTAFGLTNKFKSGLPGIPALGLEQRGRRLINNFSLEPKPKMRVSAALDFPLWRQKARLDTIEYYHFLYPGRDIYRFETTAPDSVTQFSPYVVNAGVVQPVHVIYVDQKPVYFSWSENERPYAFSVTPGYHRIELRGSNRLYRIDSLYVPARQKLIFSLSDSVQTRHVSSIPMPYELTSAERDNLYRYIFPYRYAFGGEMPYLLQKGNAVLLQQKYRQFDPPGAANSYGNSRLAGPVMSDSLRFVFPEGYETRFVHEAFFEYDFSKALLKMRQVDPKTRYPLRLTGTASEQFKDWVFSEPYLLAERSRRLDAYRRQYARYRYPVSTAPNEGKLQVELPSNAEAAWPLNVLLLHGGNPAFLRVYPGTAQVFHALSPGIYRLVWIYPDDRYAHVDSLRVEAGGLTFQRIENLTVLDRDTFSMRMNQLLEQQLFSPNPNQKAVKQEIGQMMNLYQGNFSWSGPGRMIRGRVTDENGEPLIGASVIAGNRSNGTITDIEGYYNLFLPEGVDEIEIFYVGYETQRITDISQRPQVDAAMAMGEGALLQEVVVTAYKVPLISQDQTVAGMALTSDQIRNLSTRDINALSGRIAGLSLEEDGEVSIQGSRLDAAYYYIDGVRVDANALNAVDRQQIQSMELVSGDAAAAVFGPEGAKGVVLITTKKGGKGADFDDAFLEAASQASSIRSNFSDYAFWQPRLRTDEAGKATFKVTFPDDITNWRTFVLAMNDHKQTGSAEGNIRSFKPLAARLSLPRFLVQGDSAWAIGKVLNYTPDTVSLRAGFAIGAGEARLRDYQVADAVTDSVLLAPTSADSLQLKFFLQKADGYTDGEQRSIDVLPKGLERTAGQFVALEGDTTLQWTFPDSLGEVHLYARADVLDVVEEEIARLIHYQYDCNEQMASRLKALLAEAQIAIYKNKPFPREAQVEKLITRILNNQNGQGLWGWWNKSATSFWISTHVLEALAQARSMGYRVALAEQKITEQAIWELESNTGNDQKLELLYLLRSFGAKFKYEAYLPFIEKDTTLSVFNRFRLMELQQLCGLEWNRDTLNHYRQETLFGNVYFLDDGSRYSPDRSKLQLTLAAYRLLQRDSLPDKALLGRIRNYLLEQRSNGQWNNTYESAQIISAILPDLKTKGDTLLQPVLNLSGAVASEVKMFPYEVVFAPGKPLNVSKTGNFPVYFTAYQRYWDTAPRETSENFRIRSAFASGGDWLRAGKPETLVVTVDVNKDARYVMIEVPIPAACSYESKESSFSGEVHREYFRHKTAIFCENLRPGTYKFAIRLLPRYTGKFVLNPAKVELMYFPVFQANNEGRKVEVLR